MGSAVQSSPLTSTLTMRAFLTVFLASLTLLSTIPSTTERGRLRLSPSLTLSDRSLPDITLLTLLLREDFIMLESLLTLPCTLSLPLSTTVWLDTPDIIPMSTARGRLRPSPSTDTSPEFPLTCTTLVPTTVLSDIPDIIPTSTARGRLRPSPSTVTPPELSLTCTTLLLSLPLVSDTLSPSLDTDMSLTPPTLVSAQTSPVSRFLVRWRRSRRVTYDENIRYQ